MKLFQTMRTAALFLGVFLFCSPGSFAQGDNRDGTFSNPVLWADFPDPDVIRVGNKYYFVSTSMHMMPGATVLESDDLVNWRIASNALEEFKILPTYDLQDGNRYAKGQWATAIRYFNDRFYVLFNSHTDGGAFMCTAPTAAGPWELHSIAPEGLYDPGLFIDNDGRVYVIHGNTDISVTELTADGLNVKSPAQEVYRAHRRGLEGNRCYHIGDYYYIYCTYARTQVCLRSKSLYGPWEEREVMSDMVRHAPTILHQGCLIDLPDGSYWCMIFQDYGGLGRLPFLVPVTWVDGWPVPGNPWDGNARLNKPIAGTEYFEFPTTDEFNSPSLDPLWQFNHNPDRDKYSLTERQGWLRLHAATVTNTLTEARNTVCQRIFGPHSQATVKMDISKMRNGDRAGLTVFQSPFATLTVSKTRQGTELQMTENEEVKESVSLGNAKTVYLRAKVNGLSDKVNFFYSLDNETFSPLGTEFTMRFSLQVFVGNRFGLFNYATDRLGGYVDVDWIRVEHEPLLDRTALIGQEIDAEYFDYIYNAEVALSKNETERRNQDVSFGDGGIIAYKDFRFPERNVRKVEVTYTASARNATLEVRCFDTGKIYGTYKLDPTEEAYVTKTFELSDPLQSTGRLEFRVWNQGGYGGPAGSVAVDKFKFVAQ